MYHGHSTCPLSVSVHNALRSRWFLEPTVRESEDGSIRSSLPWFGNSIKKHLYAWPLMNLTPAFKRSSWNSDSNSSRPHPAKIAFKKRCPGCWWTLGSAEACGWHQGPTWESSTFAGLRSKPEL